VDRKPAQANRLVRRVTLLKARRAGTFDPDQLYQEGAWRGRVARQCRVAMRRQRLLFLLAPRWSRPDRFLDELASDLLIGRPRVSCAVLPLAVVHGRAPHEIEGYILRAVAEVANLDPSGAAHQPVTRDGFREILAGQLAQTVSGPQRALLLLGVEHVSLELVQDLYDTLVAHAAEVGERRRFNILFSGSVALPRGRFPEILQQMLPDYGPDEAAQAVHEYVDLASDRDADLAAALVGGVPALLHAVGVGAEKSHDLPTTQEAIWECLGPLADELRAAVAIVAADQGQADRLEALARAGSSVVAPEIDGRLIRAGVIRGVPRVRVARVVVRAPILAQLAGSVLGQGADEAGGPVMVETD
jgi:hypothetical protein